MSLLKVFIHHSRLAFVFSVMETSTPMKQWTKMLLSEFATKVYAILKADGETASSRSTYAITFTEACRFLTHFACMKMLG